MKRKIFRNKIIEVHKQGNGYKDDRKGRPYLTALDLMGNRSWVRATLAIALLAIILSFPLPVYADGGAPNLAYVAGTSHGVSIIDIAQQKVTSTISLGGDPHSVYLSLDGRFLYVTQPASGHVAMLAAKTGQVICTASVPGQPTLLAFDPGINILYAGGNATASISAIDATNCTIRRIVKTDGPVYGLAVAVVGSGASGGNGNQLWVADSSSLNVFDSTGKQLISIPVPGGPGYISIPPGTTVYTVTRNGEVVAVDLSQKRVLSPPLLTNGSFGPMDYDAITGEVYVPDMKNNQLDVLSPVLPDTAKLPHEPGRIIHLGGTPQAVAITSDGQLGFVALATGYIVMLDLPGRQTANIIYVGGSPHFIITGLYPPLIGTTPQQASMWETIFSILAYVIVIALILVPTLLIWRHRARQGQGNNVNRK